MENMNVNKRNVVNKLHKQARKNFLRRLAIVKGIDDLCQVDLHEMIAHESYNRGYRYRITVVNTFSKKAWAEKVKNKTFLNITEAMKNIFNIKTYNCYCDWSI